MTLSIGKSVEMRRYIVIDAGSASRIDVNTGRNKGGREVEKPISQTNLERL